MGRFRSEIDAAELAYVTLSGVGVGQTDEIDCFSSVVLAMKLANEQRINAVYEGSQRRAVSVPVEVFEYGYPPPIGVMVTVSKGHDYRFRNGYGPMYEGDGEEECVFQSHWTPDRFEAYKLVERFAPGHDFMVADMHEVITNGSAFYINHRNKIAEFSHNSVFHRTIKTRVTVELGINFRWKCYVHEDVLNGLATNAETDFDGITSRLKIKGYKVTKEDVIRFVGDTFLPRREKLK